jgi:hypothetical protein
LIDEIACASTAWQTSIDGFSNWRGDYNMQHELGIFEGSPRLFTDTVIEITDGQIWDEKAPVKDGFHFLSNDYPSTG